MRGWLAAFGLVVMVGCASAQEIVPAPAPPVEPPRCLRDRAVLAARMSELLTQRDNFEMGAAVLVVERNRLTEDVKRLTHENRVARERLLEYEKKETDK